MKGARCERMWEADAISQGRLGDGDRASFERHAATCGACASELRSVAKLDARLRSLESPASDPMRRARLRRRVVASFGKNVRSPKRPLAWVAIPAIALAIVAFVLWGRAARRASPIAEVRAPAYEVDDARGGVWTVATVGGATTVTLTAGEVACHVDKLGARQRFVVVLPDGELEVRGTRFSVAIAASRTHAVAVTEGVVALRIRGAAERVLRAGDRWEEAVVAAPPPPATVASAAPSPRVVSAHARATVVPAATASESASAPASTSDDFMLAVAAFRRGAWGEADHLFEAFQARAPNDSRAEDAAYLRAVAHARMGDAAGASRLAHAYLAAFPRGLRRREAEHLALP